MMLRTRTPALAVALAMILTASIVLVGSAQPVAANGSGQGAAMVEPILLDAMAEDSIDPSTQRIGLIVRLDGPTLTQLSEDLAAGRLDGRLGSAADAAADGAVISPAPSLTALDAGLKASQQAPVAAIEATGALVIDRYQVTLNGLLVEASLDQIDQIAAVDGVTSVRVAPLLKPLMEDTVPHIGASAVWEDLGYDGTGAVIAIIDTGVDYTHAAFGGEGTREAFTSNDENVVEPGTFPTEKVIGGYDLAGHRYAPNCQPGPGIVCTGPNPDPDPLDPEARAHGTHVASIAGGMATDLISAGVAPGAGIIALKVFGDPVGAEGSTNLSNSAIEWVVRNNLAVDTGNPGIAPQGAPANTKVDVINLSLGSDWGGGMVEAEAVINAAIESGVTVVASAGNDGHFPYITGSPSSSELALSVANTTPPQEFALNVVAEWEDDGVPKVSNEMAIEGSSSGDQAWLPPLALTGEIAGELAWYGMACNDNLGRTPEPAQDLEGKVALIERGKCAFYDKITNAETFGAIGVVVFSDARPRTIMGCGAPSDCANGPSIPGVMVERDSGLRLLELVFDREIPVDVSIDPEREVELVDTVSPDSSRGPSRHLSAIKPQISAPGQQIMAARAGTGTDGEKFSGTSMSGPVVAGVAALLWQRNYDEQLGLKPLDISALAMNYARPRIHITPPDTGGRLAPVARQGAGLVDARASASAMTVVRSQRGIAGLSYGNFHTTDQIEPVAKKKTLTVRNLSDVERTYKPEYRLSFPEQDSDKGVSLSFKPELLKVAPNWTAELEVTLHADPESMRKEWPLRGYDPVRKEGPFIEQEIDGYVTLVEVDGNGDELADGDQPIVPFHSLPRTHSCIESGAEDGHFTLAGPGDTVSHQLTNLCNVDAPVEVFSLGGTDPVDADVPAKLDILAAGVRTFEDASGNTILDFAIHTRGDRRIAQDGDARIYLDLNQDGVWDRMAFSREGVLALGTSDTEAYGRWFVQHLRPNGTGLPLGGSSLSNGGYWQPFDIDESVTRLLISGDDPIMGLGLDFESGDVEFNWTARIVDRIGDFEYNGRNPQYDDAPDGWTDRGGPTYTFKQQAAHCLRLETEDGTSMAPGQLAEFTVPAGGDMSLDIRGCIAEEGPLDTGLLFNFPSNVPGPEAAQVRTGEVERNQPTLYVPYTAKNHKLVASSGLMP